MEGVVSQLVPHQTRHLDLLSRHTVGDEVALPQDPLVDPHVRQLPKAPLLQLEGETHQRAGWGAREGHLFEISRFVTEAC
jgi:hypothetical protein